MSDSDEWDPLWLDDWLQSDGSFPPPELKDHLLLMRQRMRVLEQSENSLIEANINTSLLKAELEGTKKASQENGVRLEQQRLENQRLQEAVQMNRAVVESVAEPLLLLDATMRVQMMNQAAKAFFKMSDSSGMHLGELVRGISMGNRKAQAQGKALVEGEQVPVRCEVNEVELYRDVIGYTCLVHDLRRELRKQQQLILQARLTYLGELVAGVAHEINNAVNFINGTLPQMERELETLIDEQTLADSRLQRQLERCREGARRTTSIVRSLKSFAHPGTGEMVAVDLRENVAVTLALLERHSDKTIDIEYDYQPELPQCVCHPEQINQVLMNLLHNAMQAISIEGTIHIRIKENPRNWLQLQVQDSGCGMSPDIVTHIFEPFFTTKAQGVGTGMGLSLTQNIIVRHGGRIAVNSKPGKGTTFFVTLPLLGCDDLEDTQG